jgi:hypothetical protein
MTWALRIAAATLLILAALAFHRWDLYHVDPSHPRYVHTHDWVGGPDILQLTAFAWLASAAIICLLLGIRGGAAGWPARSSWTREIRGAGGVAAPEGGRNSACAARDVARPEPLARRDGRSG